MSAHRRPHAYLPMHFEEMKSCGIMERMSKRRRLPGGWADKKSLPKGPNGRALCRWCKDEVQPPRRTFCSDACVDQWRLRTDPGYLRDRVFRRDKGVCAICRTNTVRLSAALRKLNFRGRKTRCAALGIPFHRLKSMWDADHIVPVAEGGGECDLANIRTLCIPCHRRATQELMNRLRAKRAAEQAVVGAAVPSEFQPGA